MHKQFFAASLAAITLASVASADFPNSGYEKVLTEPNPGVFAAYATLPTGDRVVFDGEFCDIYDSSGFVIANLGSTGQGFGFASFVVLDPSGTFAFVGESNNNGLYKVDLGGAGFTPLGTMVFNFSAVMETPTTAIVSAATGGFNAGNDLIRVDLNTGAQTPLGHVPGPSGPVAFDSSGNLFYITQSDLFPTPAGSLELVKWDAATLGAGSIDEMNWTVIESGFDGGSSLAVDPANDHLYLAESVFGRPQNYIFAFDELGQRIGQVVASNGTGVGSLEVLVRGSGDELRPFREGSGNLLSYNSSAFGGVNDIIQVGPERPRLTIGGPGVDGVGRYELTITGAPPHGKIALWRDAQSLILPNERSVDLGFSQPIISDLSMRALVGANGMPNAYNFDGLTLTASKDGVAKVTFFNNGRVDGIFVYEALIMSPILEPLATTNTVVH